MNLLEFKDQLFAQGSEQGFTDMELYYEREEKFGCGLYKGEIDSYETSEVFGVSFRGLLDGKMGYAYTEKLDEESIVFLLENAKENSHFIEDEEQEEIFPGSEKYEEGNFYSETLKEVSIAEKLDFLKEIEKHIYAYDERVDGTDYFIFNSAETERAILNNKGLSLNEKQNYLGMYISVVVKQGDEIKTGVYSKFTQDFQSLNPADIAKHAVEEALSQLGAKSVESKDYRVLLRHDAAGSLLNTFSPIFSAESTQKGQSLLKDKVGEEISVPFLQIVDDPTLSEGLLSRTFDSEGVATSKQDIVKDGKLVTLLHNRKTAKKDKTESTGHAYKSSYKSTLEVAPTNLFIQPAEKSYDDLIAGVEEGIIITELSGLHSGANTVSGDFSVAANGFYIKGGKVETPVKQMTIAGNFYELLKNVEEVGSDLEFAMSFVAPGYIGSPSLVIKELSVTVD
ncbi:TldD/PmbA family protein [Cytobacillus sp. FJAT-54145]|uniref:TldD/PmbA family protein n=1 Tax=Cytobacillus spartinae TaxID=3299023 RepID=A0ABW6KBA1_9BACI